MAGSRKKTDQPDVRRRPPATSPEEQEKRLMSLAMEQIEDMLVQKKATSQILALVLKMGNTQAELEKEKLRAEIVKMEAQTKAMESERRLEDLYTEALDAMRSYGSSINHMDDTDE